VCFLLVVLRRGVCREEEEEEEEEEGLLLPLVEGVLAAFGRGWCHRSSISSPIANPFRVLNKRCYCSLGKRTRGRHEQSSPRPAQLRDTPHPPPSSTTAPTTPHLARPGCCLRTPPRPSSPKTAALARGGSRRRPARPAPPMRRHSLVAPQEPLSPATAPNNDTIPASLIRARCSLRQWPPGRIPGTPGRLGCLGFVSCAPRRRWSRGRGARC